ncbi:MAG: IS1182 family transposase [Chloroflexi bacterium]|nr:IS1182 family transposase [Chloroflexota bacterium]
MMGRRPDQGSLFGAQRHYLDLVGVESFYGFLAVHGQELFSDDDFAVMYCHENGRPSVAPSLLAMAVLLKTHDRVSDDEAKQRADFDLRWKVALGIDLEERPFAKSTLQLFRAHLMIHDKARLIFERSLGLARSRGHLKGRKMRAALDTTVIFGRGAVEDTYNLIAHGIAELCRGLAEVAEEELEAWAEEHGLGRYFGSSFKGTAAIDWDDAAAREQLLTAIIADGKRLLELAREARSKLEEDSAEDRRIAASAELLTQLLWQDVEPTDRGYRIKKGTAEDRIPSVHDPEQRHGRKSHGRTFTGHKASVAVDVDSQLITAVDVIPGNGSDGAHAAELVEAAEANTGARVEQVIGDTAYGGMETRKELGDREVIAPTVKPHGGRGIPKDQFDVDVEGERVVCPEGHETRHWRWTWVRVRRGRPHVRTKVFAFPKEICRACPRRGECYSEKSPCGRTITLHPDEARLQAARALEQTEYFREQYRERVVVEHRIARLVQLGIRQSRYFGRAKTRFQLMMAATVANLTLVAGAMLSKRGRWGFRGPVSRVGGFLRALFGHIGRRPRLAIPARLSPMTRQTAARRPMALSPELGFRPGF